MDKFTIKLTGREARLLLDLLCDSEKSGRHYGQKDQYWNSIEIIREKLQGVIDNALIEQRFWSKVKTGPQCWEWTGALHPSGYGMFNFYGKTQMTHRVSWHLEEGEIPEGMCVLHTCDNPRCVNPHHLILGSHRDNMRDMYSKGRGITGERNGRSKLTVNDVLNIRLLDIPQRNLAQMYSVHHGTIHAIKSGRTWKEVA